MASTFLVSPSTPTGNNRRIELVGMDLWIHSRIDNVYVYPGEIKLDQLREALSRTLSLWPLVAGRMILENDQDYIIEMCDNPIPITLVINNDLKEWPLDSNVIVETDNKDLPTFIDEIQLAKVFDNSFNEPLVRLKLTHITQSNEWVLGISWYHLLGDADACLKFSNTLSRFYQQMESIQPIPIFERRVWREDEADRLAIPIPKQYEDAQSVEIIEKILSEYEPKYEPVYLHFSGEQLATLRILAGGNNVTIQDALTAYIILTLNVNCYKNNDERRILHSLIVTNIRGISDSVASQAHAGNCLFIMVSDNFDDPYSLSNIAKTLRQSIIHLRDPKVLEPGMAIVDGFMRRNVRDKKLWYPRLIPNEIIVNSNLRFDWAGLVDFGYTDKCRFYTSWTSPLYLRVFRMNPTKTGDQWLPRDQNGAEIAFRIEKDLKENFINAWKQDIIENFQNIKK